MKRLRRSGTGQLNQLVQHDRLTCDQDRGVRISEAERIYLALHAPRPRKPKLQPSLRKFSWEGEAQRSEPAEPPGKGAA